MIRLALVRHGKAADGSAIRLDADGEEAAGPGHDHARPLTDRGRRDADRLGVRFLEAGWHPTAVLCSDASRTRETWERLRGVFARAGIHPEVLLDRRLYLAGPEDLAEVARDLGSARGGTLLAVGHNPGWEQALAHLSGERRTLPTTGTALLELAGGGFPTWNELLAPSGRWTLRDLWLPDT